jgi:hypothetical protein
MMKTFIVLTFSVFAFNFSFAQNAIVTENALPGNPNSQWDLNANPDGTFGDASIMGFATDISVNVGSTIDFKVTITSGTDKTFGIQIYRLGFYQGNGARLIADLGSAFTGITQNGCGVDATTGLTDCGNWTVSASWAVPANVVSGIYIAKLTRSAAGGGGSNHIIFVVRNDASTSPLYFKASDATWQAYNNYGGNSLYVGAGLPNNHGSKVSYNRPFLTRNGGGGGGVMEDWVFNAEYPMIRFLEQNGFDISYTTDVDLVRNGNLLLNHNVFMSVGHDEYWSAEERNSVEAARSAGKHLAFFSGNEIYWKTRWENSTDGTNTPYRTMVCYKEGTLATPAENPCGGKCDPTQTWTGLWRDGCGYPGVTDACKPENALSGEISWDGTGGTITVPFAYKSLRFWRNTPNVANLTSGQTATLAPGTLGYEWDWEQYASSNPPGRITMSNTLLNSRTHKLSLYKTSIGGWVFGAGTVQWAWGLDNNHDKNVAPWNQTSIDMQQATINLFADMGVQPATLMTGLIAGTASTDVTPPVTIITSPANGAIFRQGDTITISGTASDVGGVVGGVEISTDGGSTWLPATGTNNWTFTWVATTTGNIIIKSRGVDDSGNLETPGGNEGSPNTINITVSPLTQSSYSLFTTSQGPNSSNGETGLNDGLPLALGVKFKSTVSGYISGIRFYKSSGDTAHNKVQLWNLGLGTLMGEAQLTGNATNTGWNEVSFLAPIQISANTVYEASYYSPTGYYSGTPNAYRDSAITNGPLIGLKDGTNGVNGLYDYGQPGPPEFPNPPLQPSSGFKSTNYWVDVDFLPTIGPDTIPPHVVSVYPGVSSTDININSFITATFTKDIDTTTVTSSTFFLTDVSDNIIPTSVSYSVRNRTATLIPASPLDYSTSYNATVKGGTSGPRIKDTLGNILPADFVWTFTTSAIPAAPPDDGAGGPVLVVSSSTNPFSRYPVEILRAEGYNGFRAKDISEVTSATLDSFDVVILGQIANNFIPPSFVTLINSWVNAGGTFIAFRPPVTNTALMSLMGIASNSGTLIDQYMIANPGLGLPGTGIVNQTIQFHGPADQYNLAVGTSSLATLYSSATTATTFAAVTSRSVGVNGGKAIAFAYDLAKSVIYTRQGNPSWAGQSRDGQSGPIRSDNLFFPNWIDFNKIHIPQADEQQHLLSNIILLSNLHKKPLPRLWFLPNKLKAAVVMTGDDHNFGNYPGSTGTEGRFNEYLTMGPNSPSDVADWNAVRGTSYIYNNTPIPDDSVVYYQNLGFEIALHPTTSCLNFTPASLNATFVTELTFIQQQLPSLNSPVSNRTHCLPWSDWASQAKIENALGIRYDVNYYYWPGSWIQNRPGMFTGSGMPMRFADLDGSIIDCYQSPTFITDESQQDIPLHITSLLDSALGTAGYYGVFTMNMHTDSAIHTGSDAIIAAAQARNIPVVSAKQMLNWVDSRNGTVFGPMTWQNSRLSFTITTTAHNLQAMVPVNSADGALIDVTENGTSIPFTVQTIKGIPYGFFAAGNNSYVAVYSSTPLPITLLDFTVTKQGDDAQLNWTTTMEENNKGFEIQRSTDNSSWNDIGFVPGAINSQIKKDYQYLDRDLPAGTYYYRLKQIDLDGHLQYSKVVQVTFSGNLSLELKQNRPNPLTSNTTIDIVIPKTCRVQLILYDQMGRPVQQLMDEYKSPGLYSIPVNRNGLSSGVYYYQMNAMGQTLVKKMTIF